MSEKKVIYQANVISLPPLKWVLGEGFPLHPKRDDRMANSEIRQPGIEMQTIVSKLITHLKEK